MATNVDFFKNEINTAIASEDGTARLEAALSKLQADGVLTQELDFLIETVKKVVTQKRDDLFEIILPFIDDSLEPEQQSTVLIWLITKSCTKQFFIAVDKLNEKLSPPHFNLFLSHAIEKNQFNISKQLLEKYSDKITLVNHETFKQEINAALDNSQSDDRLATTLLKLKHDNLIDTEYPFLHDAFKEMIRLKRNSLFKIMLPYIQEHLLKEDGAKTLIWIITNNYIDQLFYILEQLKKYLSAEYYDLIFFHAAESGNFRLAYRMLKKYADKINLNMKFPKQIMYLNPKDGTTQLTSVSVNPITAAAIEGHDDIIGLIYSHQPCSGTYIHIEELNKRIDDMISPHKDKKHFLYVKNQFQPLVKIEKEFAEIEKAENKDKNLDTNEPETIQQRTRRKMEAKREAKKREEEARKEAAQAKAAQSGSNTPSNVPEAASSSGYVKPSVHDRFKQKQLERQQREQANSSTNTP